MNKQYKNISELKIGSEIDENDIIKTEGGSTIELQIGDDSRSILCHEISPFILKYIPSRAKKWCWDGTPIIRNFNTPFSIYAAVCCVNSGSKRWQGRRLPS